MPLGNEKFKLRQENGFERIGDYSILFHLASPLRATIRNNTYEIIKITILKGNSKKIGGELQGGKYVSLYYSTGVFAFPVNDDIIKVMGNNSLIIENDNKEITIEVKESDQEE